MSEILIGAIIGGVAPALIAVLSSLITSRVGLVARLRETEYRLKRLQLVREMKTFHKEHPSDHDWSVLDGELEELLQFVQSTGIAAEDRVAAGSAPKSRLSRLVLLTSPRTTGGRIVTFLYYLYGVAGVFYIAVAIANLLGFGIDQELVDLAFPGAAGSLLLAWFARKFARRLLKRHHDAALQAAPPNTL